MIACCDLRKYSGATMTSHHLAELAVRMSRVSSFVAITAIAYAIYTPSWETVRELRPGWIAALIVRDVVGVLLAYSGWHWVLYNSPLAARMRCRKFNPEYPPAEQWSHDRFHSLAGTVQGALWEAVTLHLIARGWLPCAVIRSAAAAPWAFALGILLVPYWRELHFYAAHRVMHPWWRTPAQPPAWLGDPGAWLYRHVHSLHHRSPNPGPWSGLSMHWGEHLLYFTCVLFPACVRGAPVHMFHVAFCKWHALVSPLPGHDGFDTPGGGSAFHYVHHALFHVNFGTPLVPLDALFGTYADGAEHFARMRSKREAD